MTHVRTTREAGCNIPGRAHSSALLLLAIASLLIACGGGSSEPSTTVLQWSPPSAQNISGYRLYFGNAPSTYMQLPGEGVRMGTVTTYTVSGLDRGARYYFAVTAYDTSNIESTYSNEVFKDIP